MHQISTRRGATGVEPAGKTPARHSRFETQVLTIPRGISRTATREMLADQAEYGKWELQRVQIYRGGARKVWLRRRVVRVERTDAA